MTIKIDREAYARLQCAGKPGESFSQTIKRVMPKPFDLERWLRKTKRVAVSDQVLDAVEEEIARRRRPIKPKRTRNR